MQNNKWFDLVTQAGEKSPAQVDQRKKYYLVIDTECIFRSKIFYSLGFCVIDREGNLYDYNEFLAEEVISNPITRPKLLDSKKSEKGRYYRETEIKTCGVQEIFNSLEKVAKQYRKIQLVAHNARHDKAALIQTSAKYGVSNPFSDSGWLCTQEASKTTFWSGFDNYCQKNNCLSKKTRQPSRTAQNIGRYCTKDETLKEAHTGLYDALLEACILVNELKRHKALVKAYVQAENSRLYQRRKGKREMLRTNFYTLNHEKVKDFFDQNMRHNYNAPSTAEGVFIFLYEEGIHASLCTIDRVLKLLVKNGFLEKKRPAGERFPRYRIPPKTIIDSLTPRQKAAYDYLRQEQQQIDFSYITLTEEYIIKRAFEKNLPVKKRKQVLQSLVEMGLVKEVGKVSQGTKHYIAV